MRRLCRPILFAALLASALARAAGAHCDTADGPVIAAARQALAAGDVTPVLRWVQPADEGEIREAFTRTLQVRGTSDVARDLADRFFFETLVRVHRQGEGFPYEGLKPAGTPVSPAIRAADAALESGSAEALIAELQAAVAKGVAERLAHAREAKRFDADDVTAGRRFVAAYVELTHYAEAVESAAAGHGAHQEAAPAHAHD